MIPLSLKLSNFTSYGEDVPELDFSKFHLAVISGTNGVGKSSILDAITWCVWGWSRAGDSADDLVRLGATEMYVQFSFELDGHTYTVKRRRSKKAGGNSALELWSNSHNLTEGTIKATQQKIINILHLTYETFTNSSYLRQGHADEFTTKGATERKRILADILGLDHYDLLEEKAKEKTKEAQTKLTLLDYQLLEIEAELSQKEQNEQKQIQAEKKIVEVEQKISILEKELKNLQTESATLNATLKQQVKLKQTLSEAQKELDNILTQGKIKTEKIKTLEVALQELPTFDQKLKELKGLEKQKEEYSKSLQQKLELQNKLTKIKSESDLKEAEKNNLQKKLVEINSHLKLLEKDRAKCPTCGQEVGKEQKQKVKSDYLEQQKQLNQQISEINTDQEQKDILKLQEEIRLIDLDDHQYKQTLQMIAELSNLQSKREQLIADQATLESEKKFVLELRSLFTNRKSQIAKLEQDIKTLPDLEDNLTNINLQTSQKESGLNMLKIEEREVRNLLGQAKELISRSEQMQKLFDQRKEEKEQLQKQKEAFEELALAFGKKGIQAMIIETAIPEIEDEANRLLDRLTEGRMKVRFETQKETKTKVATGLGTKERATMETLDIIISDEMGERSYELYSGGEAFRVNFAIRLALSKLLARRAGAKLQFLVIDEGFGTQDQQGRTRIVEVLDTIKDDFDKIVVITHLDELKEEFPVRVEVSKNGAGSTFEVVSD